MSENDIPQWAVAEACKRVGVSEHDYRIGAFVEHLTAAIYHLAECIAAHEEAPVDPLVKATRETLGEWADHTWGKGNSFAAKYRRGESDGDSNFTLASTALRRGIELAKSGAA